MNKKLVLWSIVVALGGLLFGIDVAVISGAEQDIKRIWNLSDVTHGVAIGMALYGTVLGALTGGFPAARLGRKKTLIWIGVFYLVSAVGSALAPEVYSFMAFRFLGGLAIGASSVVAPMYIAEIAPAKNRGKLVTAFQFNIVFGILLAYFSNYLLQDAGPDSWRWMLGIVAFPSLVYLLLVFFVPESPRWLLVHNGDAAQARAILEVSDPEGADKAIADLRQSIAEDQKKESLASFFTRRYSKPILLAIAIAAFNQLSGINAIIYYAPRVFALAGIGKEAAFLQSAYLLGQHGLSALCVWFAASLALWLRWEYSARAPLLWRAPVAVFLLLHVWGAWRIWQYDQAAHARLGVLLVATNISSLDKNRDGQSHFSAAWNAT